MQAALPWCALGLYGLSLTLAALALLRGRRRSLPAASLASLAAGLAFHGVALAAAIENGGLPVADVQGAVSVLAFTLTLAFFLVYLRYRVGLLGVFMLPFVFVLTLVGALGTAPDSPSFLAGWLTFHIATMILGYTGLFLTFVGAVMYLVQERELKSKASRGIYYRLPSLEVCDRLYYRSLVFGLVFLTAGFVSGFVVANRAWSGGWEFDPKIVASFITWIICLGLVSARLGGGWGARRSAYLAIVGFAAMLVTLGGASLLSAQHGLLPNLGPKP